VDERERKIDRFEADRGHLFAVAYRMLGSRSDAEDAVQQAWLRYARADVDDVENVSGWLTTVVSRLCLDALRSRASRREVLAASDTADDLVATRPENDPEREAELADSVGRALLVVLDRLDPAERIAFVLHDMFAVPFDEIAPVVERTTGATKKLASRARHRVRGTPVVGRAELARHRKVVDAFLAASRAGDIEAVIAVLAPDVVRRADRYALPSGRPLEAHGARTVAEEIAVFGANARYASPALVDGRVGVVVAGEAGLQLVLTFAIENGAITAYELVAEPARLEALELAVLSP
jgi:RNA polymerase sigma-70 factor (ECF subfamily)